MELKLDRDVQAVTEFMQSNLPASKLAPVAVAVNKLADSLWGHYSPESVTTLTLMHPQITSSPQSTASV